MNEITWKSLFYKLMKWTVLIAAYVIFYVVTVRMFAVRNPVAGREFLEFINYNAENFSVSLGMFVVFLFMPFLAIKAVLLLIELVREYFDKKKAAAI